MRVSDIQTCLSIGGGTTSKRAEAIATELRGANLLPKGGRGPYAPDADAVDAAAFVLAVVGAERIGDAVMTSLTLSALIDASGCPLSDILTGFLRRPQSCSDVRRLIVQPIIPMAEINFYDGPSRFFSTSAFWETDVSPVAQMQGFAGHAGLIGGAVLFQIAKMLETRQIQETIA